MSETGNYDVAVIGAGVSIRLFRRPSEHRGVRSPATARHVAGVPSLRREHGAARSAHHRIEVCAGDARMLRLAQDGQIVAVQSHDDFLPQDTGKGGGKDPGATEVQPGLSPRPTTRSRSEYTTSTRATGVEHAIDTSRIEIRL